ncbi:imidazole glycerol phosphate synthase cyclase subunit [Thalassospira alkalitolerans]|uniref:imidazole glycerol phosphate synthase subunit HisF n=1 Tax=Thalassospira alkalitolerans TaxID=1293890 RepID=UPI0030EEDC60|tara:strand:- start:34816 stop:35568 length:753 start_codon:yes stop_codon:yes gene_type:complete
MITKRIVTTLTFNNGILFRTKLFTPDYRYTANFIDAWSVDEIVVLDISRDGRGQNDPFFQSLEKLAQDCMVPIAAGGGIQSIEDVQRFLDRGADKIVLNTAAIRKPQLITEIAERYGRQCIVVSIDARRSEDGLYEVYSDCGRCRENVVLADWVKKAEELGAGEILITSIDRDGWLQGYDLELVSEVSSSCEVPVLALGGCGNWAQMDELFAKTNVSAACTQNIYHFTESSIKSAKKYLAGKGVHVRPSV